MSFLFTRFWVSFLPLHLFLRGPTTASKAIFLLCSTTFRSVTRCGSREHLMSTPWSLRPFRVGGQTCLVEGPAVMLMRNGGGDCAPSKCLFYFFVGLTGTHAARRYLVLSLLSNFLYFYFLIVRKRFGGTVQGHKQKLDVVLTGAWACNDVLGMWITASPDLLYLQFCFAISFVILVLLLYCIANFNKISRRALQELVDCLTSSVS
jgi:hypothetical protein